MKRKIILITLTSALFLGFINAQTAGTFSQVTIGSRTNITGSATRLTFIPLKHANNWTFNTRDSNSDAYLDLFYSTMQQITFKWNTGIGIGVDNPQYKLDVNGTIRAKEVRVETGWADFVFDENYDLPSLNDVEAHIKNHKHLPDIPSEAEVMKDGIGLGEINAKLLQKIEELTLYTIQQQKMIDELGNKIQQLEISVNQ